MKDGEVINPPLYTVSASDDETLRDKFATAALQGIISRMNDETSKVYNELARRTKRTTPELVAHMAYNHADAMLAERNKVKSDG